MIHTSVLIRGIDRRLFLIHLFVATDGQGLDFD